MSHETFAFFQFMGDRIGVNGLIDMLHQMPTTPTYSAQTAALAAVPGIDAAFEEFVRTVMDNSLKDTDLTLIPLTARYTEEVAFSDLTSKVFSSQLPFVVSRYKLTFAGEREYELFIESNAALYETGAHLEGTKGNWASIPTTVGGCDELAYLLYVITAAPGDLEVTETVTTTMVTETFCDRCLVGSWEATNESMKAFMQAAGCGRRSRRPGDHERQRPHADAFRRQPELAAAHTTGSACEKRDQATIEGVDVIVLLDGAASGRYSADGSELIAFTDTTNISLSVEIFLNGVSLGESVRPPRSGGLAVQTGLPHPLHVRGRYPVHLAARRGHPHRADRVDARRTVDRRPILLKGGGSSIKRAS